MARNQTITKITAVFLILVFSQKMGMSLYLHNWLHTAKQDAAASQPLSGQEVKFACGCINDFTLPLAETAVPEISVPVITISKPLSAPLLSFPTVYKYFRSLRAPPVCIA
jgi:hypothetical protein